MSRSLFIQEDKLKTLFPGFDPIYVDSTDEIIDILGYESSCLTSRKATMGMYPDYIPISTHMVLQDTDDNTTIWLTDEIETVGSTKDKIWLPGGYVQIDDPNTSKSSLGIFVNTMVNHLLNQFLGHDYESISYNIVMAAELFHVLEEIGFTSIDKKMSMKILYVPGAGISVIFVVECYPILAFKKNTIPFSYDEFKTISMCDMSKSRAINYLGNVAAQDIRINKGFGRTMLRLIFEHNIWS